MRCDPRSLRLLAEWLIEGPGGPMRARILLLLRVEPMNPNQVARKLGINYRTARHHLWCSRRTG